jgi:soluble lytic murein transglycosylase
MRRRSLLPLPALLLAGPATALAQGTAPRAAPRPAPTAPAGDPRLAAGRNALAHANAGRWREAEAAAAQADPLVGKVVQWIKLQQRDGGTAWEVASFVLDNPEWPAQDQLARRAEEMLETSPDDDLALRFFTQRPPRTLDGFQRLADAQRIGGKTREADATLAHGWVEANAEPGAEGGYLDRNGPVLTPALHWRRFNRLVLPREANSAARLLPLLPEDRQAAASARLAFAADQADAEAPGGRPDAGLAMHRARWLRRRNRDTEAAEALKAGEADQRDLPLPLARAVWEERNILARKLLRMNDVATAYAVAANHGQAPPGEHHQEAEFLAGYIALRRLEQPAKAAAHFAKLAEQSRSVITRARSQYWQGRAEAAQGHTPKAHEHYRSAAELPLAFYGQLAAVALGENGATLSARILRAAPPAASTAEARALERRELARVVLLLAELGETRRTRVFLLRLEELAETPGDKALVARLAHRIGRPDHAIWVTRRAGIAGAMLLEEGWPTPFQPPADALDPALVFSITRQESNFDPEAVSSSNARGLMQLLPTTAVAVARRLGIQHALPMLTGNPHHNMRLGTAYIDQMVNQFTGAVPLAVAAYNAGPGRVNEWVQAFGDPRAGFIAMLDWMEQIPFSETRNYVQRVLENMAIYRARDPSLAGLDHPMTAWLAE